ncbi:dihydrodipicolinate synthase family protein [Cytobacillus horneckiae]
MKFVVIRVKSRCKVIASTGYIQTESSIAMTREVKKAGVDGVAYYKKTYQEEVYQHF